MYQEMKYASLRKHVSRKRKVKFGVEFMEDFTEDAIFN
jgi:hypothetical protein